MIEYENPFYEKTKSELIGSINSIDINDDLKSKKSSFIVLGEYGSGKTELLKRVKKDIEGREFDEVKVQSINDKDVKHISNKINTSIGITKNKSRRTIYRTLFYIMLTIFSASIGLISNINKEDLLSIKAISSILLTSISLLIMILFGILYLVSGPKAKSKKIIIIEDLDRFSWSYIKEAFDSSLMNDNIYIFTLSVSNLEERYREEYGFYPNTLMLFFEKYVVKQFDLSPHYIESINTLINEEFENDELFIDLLPFNNIRALKDSIEEIKGVNLDLIKEYFSDNRLIGLKRVMIYLQYIKTIANNVYLKIKDEFTRTSFNGKKESYKWFQESEYSWNKTIFENAINETPKFKIQEIPEWSHGFEKIIRFLYDELRKGVESDHKDFNGISLNIKLPISMFFNSVDDINEILTSIKEKDAEKMHSLNMLNNETRILLMRNEIDKMNSKQLIKYFSDASYFHDIRFNLKELKMLCSKIDENNSYEEIISVINNIFEYYLGVYNLRARANNYLFIKYIIQEISDPKSIFEEVNRIYKNMEDYEIDDVIKYVKDLMKLVIQLINKSFNTLNDQYINFYSHEKILLNGVKNSKTALMNCLKNNKDEDVYIYLPLFYGMSYDRMKELKLKLIGDNGRSISDKNIAYYKEGMDRFRNVISTVNIDDYKMQLKALDKLIDAEYSYYTIAKTKKTA